jgi:GNAT superfamily N-acetyltransferase
MEVREARTGDAAAMAAVLRRSIAELCVLDHGDDAGILAGWLRNKNPESVRDMIDRQHIVIAVSGGNIAGVGAAVASGEITLNYVSPDFRFRGVSKAILRNLEGWLTSQGNRKVRLTSTETAHRFYLACGYHDEGQPEPGSRGHPMHKDLP